MFSISLQVRRTKVPVRVGASVCWFVLAGLTGSKQCLVDNTAKAAFEMLHNSQKNNIAGLLCRAAVCFGKLLRLKMPPLVSVLQGLPLLSSLPQVTVAHLAQFALERVYAKR